MNVRTRRLRRGLPILSVIIALSASACSSSQGGSASGPSTADITKCMTAAKAVVEPYLKASSSSVPTPTAPVNAARARGKKYALVVGGLSVPAIVQSADRLKQVAALVALKQTILDGQLQVATQAQDMTQAVNQRYSSIVTSGVASTDVTAGAAAAKKAGIPVISQAGQPNDPAKYPAQPNFYASVLTNDQGVGKLKAAYALMDNGCKGKYAVMTVDYPLYVVRGDAETAELSALCPWCNVRVYKINYVSDLVGSSRSNALSALTLQPGLTAILTSDVWAPYQVAPVHNTSAGKNVRFYSEGAYVGVVSLVKQRQMRIDISLNDASWLFSFVTVDDILRGITGTTAGTGVGVLPLQLITQQNFTQQPNSAAEFDTLKAAYAKVWGLP